MMFISTHLYLLALLVKGSLATPVRIPAEEDLLLIPDLQEKSSLPSTDDDTYFIHQSAGDLLDDLLETYSPDELEPSENRYMLAPTVNMGTPAHEAKRTRVVNSAGFQYSKLKDPKEEEEMQYLHSFFDINRWPNSTTDEDANSLLFDSGAPYEYGSSTSDGCDTVSSLGYGSSTSLRCESGSSLDYDSIFSEARRNAESENELFMLETPRALTETMDPKELDLTSTDLGDVIDGLSSKIDELEDRAREEKKDTTPSKKTKKSPKISPKKASNQAPAAQSTGRKRLASLKQNSFMGRVAPVVPKKRLSLSESDQMKIESLAEVGTRINSVPYQSDSMLATPPSENMFDDDYIYPEEYRFLGVSREDSKTKRVNMAVAALNLLLKSSFVNRHPHDHGLPDHRKRSRNSDSDTRIS